MADRKRVWTPEQTVVFTRAAAYINSRSPEIEAEVEKFSSTNPFGFHARFSPVSGFEDRETHWNYLGMAIPEASHVRAVRQYANVPEIFEQDRRGRVGDVVMVHMISDEEAIFAGEFVESLGQRFELKAKRVMRSWHSSPELIALHYTLRPNFERFK